MIDSPYKKRNPAKETIKLFAIKPAI